MMLNPQEIFDAMDSAFSDFMVVDMNHPRCDTHFMPEDEAKYYARRDGKRTGGMVAAVCRDPKRLDDAQAQMVADQQCGVHGKAVDPVEECTVAECRILTYMCLKYQHDEHRPSVQFEYANECLKAMQAGLLKRLAAEGVSS